jgi:DNA polymerase-3 subunit delta
LKKHSKAQEFKSLKAPELEKWIISETAKRSNGDVSIERDAAAKIAAFSGRDLWQAGNLIRSLVSYCEQMITSRDVEIFGGEKFADKIFDLVDAIGARNISKALSIKQRLISQGENEFLIFSMIVSQLRNLLKVGDGFKKGMQAVSISSSLGMHPFVVKKTLSQLRHYDEKKIKSAFQLASRLDLETKTGELEMKDALDYLIVKM